MTIQVACEALRPYAKRPEDVVNIIYIDRDNLEHHIGGKIGDNVLFLAHRHDIDIEGACEAALVSHFSPTSYFYFFSIFIIYFVKNYRENILKK